MATEWDEELEELAEGELPPLPPQDALEPLGSTLQEVDEEMGETIPDEELYWCERSDDSLVADVKEKKRLYYEYALQHGFIDMWLAMMSEFYGRDPSTFSGFEASGIEFEGEDGELVRFRVNELHSYIRQTVTGATKERPSFKAGTLSTNYTAACQTEMVDTLANWAYEEFFGEKRERLLVERAELFATMWGWGRWDPDGGEVQQVQQQDPMTGQTFVQEVKTGEPVARVKCPWDVISDPTVEDEDDHAWRIVRERRNKFELVAVYPEMRDQIKGATLDDEQAYELSFAFDNTLATDEDVLVHHLYHDCDGVMPDGHYAVILGEHVLERGTLRERHRRGDMPLIPYQPEPMVGTSFGYSEAWDTLPIQQMTTQLTSDLATNLTAVARSLVVLPQGSEITPDQIASGVTALYVPSMEDKPVGLNLTQVAPGAFQFLDWLQKVHQVLAGQNSVTRGQPDENIKSGTMAALFHAIALEAGHIRAAAFNDFRRRMCMLLVDMMRDNAEGQFLAAVVGEDEERHLQYFEASVFEPVRDVYLETQNPMMRARSGILEMANFMKDIPGLIKTPQQVVQAFTTGQVKPLYKSAAQEIRQVEQENSRLRQGPQVEEQPGPQPIDPMTGMPQLDPMTGMLVPPPIERRVPEVPAKLTDNPWVHINEHLADYDPNEAQEVTMARDAHIEEHMRLYRKVPPDMAAIRGFAPVAPAAPMPNITSPGGDGEMSKASKKKPGTLGPVDETGTDLPKPAQPPGQAEIDGAM
jgi:hypothetical protein